MWILQYIREIINISAIDDVLTPLLQLFCRIEGSNDYS